MFLFLFFSSQCLENMIILFDAIVAHWKHGPIKMNMNIWIRL